MSRQDDGGEDVSKSSDAEFASRNIYSILSGIPLDMLEDQSEYKTWSDLGDTVELGIIRKGAFMKVQTVVNPRVHLVLYHIEGGQPSYLIIAGLVFTPLSEIQNEAVCNPVALSPCLGAMMSDLIPPSTSCCSSLREQEPCLCQYLKEPSLHDYVNSPNAKKVGDKCDVPFPTTC